jgi:hypothetical protein
MQSINFGCILFFKSIIMEVKQLDIFGKLLFGSDADAWLKLCKEQKREWILKRTNQRNEEAINEFINNPNISKECKCLDCGKHKEDGSISKGVYEKVATVVEQSNDTTNGIGDSSKRPRATKRTKNK